MLLENTAARQSAQHSRLPARVELDITYDTGGSPQAESQLRQADHQFRHARPLLIRPRSQAVLQITVTVTLVLTVTSLNLAKANRVLS
jgi:hypothetical protein